MKEYINKLKRNNGSSMTLVILAMAIVTIIILSFTIQIGNQLKSTTKNQESLQKKYDAESVIEDIISEFIESVDVSKGDELYNINHKTWTSDEIANIDVNITEKETNNSTTFTLKIKEIKESLSSKINVTVSDVSGEKYKETCNIDYEVISWRSK
ncbi:hypothetical protein [[Clostridium] dakarense]|uniref:hypothetical protein n=1 Tax=Faecalimicrobium dakarense TaxID=1301100 RepID=UPI0004B8EA85|nr:hypothetical protein [[Clostridium] dakarense]